MKFPLNLNIFGKGKKDSDDDSEEIDAENEDGEESKPEDEDDGEIGEEEKGGSKLKSIIANFNFGKFVARLKEDKRFALMLAGAALVVLSVLGGGVWLLMGDGENAQSAKKKDGISDNVVEVSSGEKIVQLLPSKDDVKPSSTSQNEELTTAKDGNAGSNEVGGASVMVAMVSRDSFKGAPKLESATPLEEAPDSALVEDSSQGPLPIIDGDGRMAWQVYARPFEAPSNHPRIAIIITGMGLSAVATEAAIKRLPGAVTLAFDANVKDYASFDKMAREAGHEILISLPMESAKFPIYDPGPLALMTMLKPENNFERLHYVLSRITGYVGVATEMGSHFSLDDKAFRPILEEIKKRGLMIIDNGVEPKSLTPIIAANISLPYAINNIFLDKDPSMDAIDARLVELEGIARENATAIAFAEPNPSTIKRLVAWIATLDGKNLTLAPVSAMPDKPIVP